MSTAVSPVGSRARDPKPERVLACVLCQQRKVKCTHKFPCTNCTRLGATCVPAALIPRQRRRRFPERELLDRCRRYEDLLRQNSIRFEPLHQDPNQYGDSLSPEGDGTRHTPSDQGSGQVTAKKAVPAKLDKSEKTYEAKNLWHAMSQCDPDEETEFSDDHVPEQEFRSAWDRLFRNTANGQGLDHILMGGGKTTDISTLHPDPAKVFRLWQIYLDNVNPLLKVTHTPTLQGRLIEAIGDFTHINPGVEALMFSIYCVAIQSLVEDDCQAIFSSTKEHLMAVYRFGCEQALLNCNFLRTDDHDCLTALFLYLISFGLHRDPRSLSPMLGVAIRIAQRMGLDSEAASAKCTVFEAEMRRRLWWSLVLFDARLGELADFKPVALSPAWDCKVPLNVSDFDLRPEMKEPPVPQHSSTSEAIFAVVRGELGDFIRRAPFYLDFTAPALKAIVGDVEGMQADRLVALQQTMEDKYLQACDPENPLHFMTIWTTKGRLAKYRLVEHYSRYPLSSVQPTEADRDAALCHALSILDCDTKIMSSHLVQGFRWFSNYYFPFPAYMHIVHELKRRPFSQQADQAWVAMSTNFHARFPTESKDDNPLFEVFAKTILQAWRCCEKSIEQARSNTAPPRIVSQMLRRLLRVENASERQDQSVASMVTDMAGLPQSVPIVPDALFDSPGYTETAPGTLPEHGLPEQFVLNMNGDEMNWAAMGWSLGVRHAW